MQACITSEKNHLKIFQNAQKRRFHRVLPTLLQKEEEVSGNRKINKLAELKVPPYECISTQNVSVSCINFENVFKLGQKKLKEHENLSTSEEKTRVPHKFLPNSFAVGGKSSRKPEMRKIGSVDWLCLLMSVQQRKIPVSFCINFENVVRNRQNITGKKCMKTSQIARRRRVPSSSLTNFYSMEKSSQQFGLHDGLGTQNVKTCKETLQFYLSSDQTS